MTTATILFPFGVRISTWVTVLVFGLIAAWRSERVPLLAMIAWLASFETAYQVAAWTLHTPTHISVIGPVSISLIVGMPIAALAATAGGARADLRLLALAVIVFVVWLATGFHVNTSTGIVSPTGEALNDASKTLWALAYLVPLFWARTSSDNLAAV